MHGPICTKIELVQDFMAVLSTCKSEEGLTKKKMLSSGQHFPKSMRPSRAGSSRANSRKWVKTELVRDFMPVLIICMFDEDCIKNEVAIVWTTFSQLYVCERLKCK